jgi:hypothetical protein
MTRVSHRKREPGCIVPKGDSFCTKVQLSGIPEFATMLPASDLRSEGIQPCQSGICQEQRELARLLKSPPEIVAGSVADKAK